jgi:hypothetical protein
MTELIGHLIVILILHIEGLHHLYSLLIIIINTTSILKYQMFDFFDITLTIILIKNQNCRHPEDRILPHTSSKSRQGAVCTSTRCHASCTFRSHLPAEVGFRAVTCPATPDLTYLLR